MALTNLKRPQAQAGYFLRAGVLRLGRYPLQPTFFGFRYNRNKSLLCLTGLSQFADYKRNEIGLRLFEAYHSPTSPETPFFNEVHSPP